jgi:hypothetical protein
MRFLRRVESVRAVGYTDGCQLLVLAFTISATYPLPSDAQPTQTPQRRGDEVMKVRFNPPIQNNLFTIPNTITVDVLSEVFPREVILRTGPTGTEVADAYRDIDRTQKPAPGPRGFTRFTFRVISCANVSSRLELVPVVAAGQKYGGFSTEPMQCKSPTARPIVTISPVAEETLHLGRQYTLRWQGGDPNYPVTIVLSCSFCTGPGITLAEKVPNNGSFVFTMTRELLREVDATTSTLGVGRCYLALRQWDAGNNVGGRTPYIAIGP